MNIFGMGLPELALIFAVALLVFGPKKLPEIGKTLGKTIRSFQDATKEFENEFKREAEAISTAMTEEPIEPPKAQQMSAQLDSQAALSPATESSPHEPVVESPHQPSP
jgi:sec-independent protein translocase protein TatA